MTQRIIAVFGPSGPNKLSVTASSLGEQIATSDILLTGGTGILDKSVKEQAIVGAERAIEAGSAGRWIGVPKAGNRTASPSHGRGFLLRTEYRNERNYINALLCDSAIALKGGPGTDSEVAFCLVLGRPVVLLGPGWNNLEHQLRQPTRAGAAVAAMIDRMFPPTKSGDRPVDEAIRSSRAASATLTHVHLDSVSSLDNVGEAVIIALESSGSVDHSKLDHVLGDDRTSQFRYWLRAE
jgi:predicted Rossmann-fold nucleotide-binding protein